jgi:predicted nuclease of predicted toxin-antitoxin system
VIKFLVDAQLPPSLALVLKENGYDAIHTLSLPNKNFTTDADICKISLEEKRVVITKDSDFHHSFILKNEPYKLLLIKAGNLRKDEVKKLIMDNLTAIITFLDEGSLIELSTDSLKLLA